MSWAAGQIRQSISQRHSFFGAVENQIASSHKALLAMKINIDEKLDPPENVVPEPVFKHASPRPGGLGPSKKDGHPGNATGGAGATRRATTICHFSFHRSFSNTRLRTQRLRIIENDVGNIIAIIRQNGPRPVASLPGGLGARATQCVSGGSICIYATLF